MRKKKALITGITGQDGSYLAELLLKKKYSVIGVTSGRSTYENIRHIEDRIRLVRGNINDKSFARRIVQRHRPHELYNLASVATIENPWNNIGEVIVSCGCVPVFLLESIQEFSPKTRYFQASSAQMFGRRAVASENTVFDPKTPYAAAKLFAHQMVVRYREDRNLFACSGILFNHESPRRSLNFVTRKITSGLAEIRQGLRKCLYLGNIDAKRDWGFAGDYVEAMQIMLQQRMPDDFVIASGELHTIREFVERACGVLGIKISWRGKGLREVGIDDTGVVIIRIDSRLYRDEGVFPQGDASKARKILGWKPKVSFGELVERMVAADLSLVQHR